MCDAIKTGSIFKCGIAPCPPLPITFIYNSSVLAMYLPDRKPTLPHSINGITCCPTMLAGRGFSSAPSFIIILAPPGNFSSAG